MTNLGMPEMLTIALVALLVVGPTRLPGIARRAGQLLGRVRSETTRTLRDLELTDDVDAMRRDLRAARDDLASVTRSGRIGPRPTSSRPHDVAPRPNPTRDGPPAEPATSSEGSTPVE